MSNSGSWTSYVSAAGLASLGCAGIMYLVSEDQKSRAQLMNSIHCHDRLDDLQALCSLMPLLVAVRGRINSANPKKCELSDKNAVLYEIVEEEIWRKERENGGVRNEPFEIKRAVDHVEWFLEDGRSTTRVRVEGAHEADRLSSAMQTHQVFVPEDNSKAGLAKFIMDKTWHMSKQGVRKTERFLPLGSIVTVVAELDQSSIAQHTGDASPSSGGDGGGGSSSSSAALTATPPAPHAGVVVEAPSAPPLPSIPFLRQPVLGSTQQPAAHSAPEQLLLRRPASGGPFVVTPLTLQQLQGSMTSAIKVYRFAALGLASLGVALIARKLLARLIKQWREGRAKARIKAAQAERRRRIAAEAQAAATAAGRDPVEAAAAAQEAAENDDRSSGTCVVCIDNPSEMIFTACGHMCVCEMCALSLRNRCPVCRTQSSAIKVFRS